MTTPSWCWVRSALSAHLNLTPFALAELMDIELARQLRAFGCAVRHA